MTDEMLRAALEEVDNAILAALPDPSACEHPFSKRFEHRMRKVRRRAKHPTAYRVLRQVACILLAILILFSSVMVLSPEARAAVVNWLRNQFNVFSQYFFVGDTSQSNEEPSLYELGWLPDGYSYLTMHASDTKNTVIYLSDSGKMIQFSYLRGIDSGPLYLDHQEYTQRSVNIGSNTADVYLSNSPDKSNDIVWSNSEEGMLFYISAEENEDVLIKLAKGVKKLK